MRKLVELLILFNMIFPCVAAHANRLDAPPSIDSQALDWALDYLLAPWTNPAEAEIFLNRIKAQSNLGPEYVDGVLELMLEQPYWAFGEDPKDELLKLLPGLADSPRFAGLSETETGQRIRASLDRLRFHDRAEMAETLKRAFHLEGEITPPKVVSPKIQPEFSDNVIDLNAYRAKCARDLLKSRK